MTPVFYSAWQVFQHGIGHLIRGAEDGIDRDAEVWMGADGGYAVGDSVDIHEIDPLTDMDTYVYVGTVADFLRSDDEASS